MVLSVFVFPGEELSCTQLAEQELAWRVKQGACAWQEHLAKQKPVATCVLWLRETKQNGPEEWMLLRQLTTKQESPAI